MGQDGPADAGNAERVIHPVGNADAGRQVFRFETFGNEKFWTDALKLPQGIVAAKLTPVQALTVVGLSVDVDALDAVTKAAVAAEIAAMGTTGPILNNPATTIKLIEANAVIGLVFKDANNDGKLVIADGDRVGLSCALCHGITDKSVFGGDKGTIGKRVDGPAVHSLDVGGAIATGLNSRAYYPVLQLKLAANMNKTIGRNPAFPGLTELSSEMDVDAYLNDKVAYPIGMFDDAPDGNGAPMHNSPLLRGDLAAPWGSEGSIGRLDNFSNLVYTGLLDPTALTTAGGRDFLKQRGGAAAGDEIVDDYIKVLTATGVTGYPYVIATAQAAGEQAPLGLRVDEQKLIDMNAYINALQAPEGVAGDPTKVARGKEVFRQRCTTCHNVDSSKPVPAFIVPMATIFTGYMPEILAQRPVELPFRPMALAPIQNSPGIFDDKMVVIDASPRMLVRGTALPLLVDLARKPNFLHDSSVPSLEALLTGRGANEPHAVYVDDAADRAAVIEFLKTLDTTP